MGMEQLAIVEENNNTKRIMVVDDYSPTRNLIVDALEQEGKYEISEACDGVEALELFQENYFDLVITDIMMPGMGGMELLNSIRESNPATAVIMITAHPALELTVSAMKIGAVDFIKKPFDIEQLLFKVNLYLHDGHSSNMRDAAQDKVYGLYGRREQLSLQNYVCEAIEKTSGGSDEVFQKIADLALRMVNGESCALFLYDAETNDFYPKVLRNKGNGHAGENVFSDLKSFFREVVDKKDALMIHSENDPLISPSVICAPLMIRDNVMGVLGVRKEANGGQFTKNDLHHILSLAKRASLNIENKVLYESIYSNVMDTFKSLIASIQARDHYTEEHSWRVSEMAAKIAGGMQCSANEVESIRMAARLHDIGKISIPDHILLKNGKLTDEEYAVIKNHPSIGEDILSPVILLDKERTIIRHHHERWDGKGYPDGLSGDRIPLLARILAVADSFDAMTSDRPYRKGMAVDIAAEELERNSDFQFDRRIIDIFLTIL